MKYAYWRRPDTKLHKADDERHAPTELLRTIGEASKVVSVSYKQILRGADVAFFCTFETSAVKHVAFQRCAGLRMCDIHMIPSANSTTLDGSGTADTAGRVPSSNPPS